MEVNLNGTLNIDELAKYAQQPPHFEPSGDLFWIDPYIAQQILAVHLDPTTNSASRPPQIIDRTVQWIMEQVQLRVGSRLLDLGCGPGLYCKRFAEQGLAVTGVDFSENSIRYAQEHDTASTYICHNYITLDAQSFHAPFDAVTLIYGDYCAMSEPDRMRLLSTIHGVLKPGGYFVLDVTTSANFTPYCPRKWTIAENGGFWSATPYVELLERYHYPEQNTFLDQYLIIEASGKLSVYRNWFQCFTLESITKELARGSFNVMGAYNDLIGTPYCSDTSWIGVVAQKV